MADKLFEWVRYCFFMFRTLRLVRCPTPSSLEFVTVFMSGVLVYNQNHEQL